ncbi:MAG: ABC transporter ATP-binding protein [Hyphomicrobiales bacterium]|nr:MAG: ABC transporter ATP-binding protein [Hyphomicrobiales bacterium]
MIRFDKVSKTFRRQTVLDELSLDIAPDDRLALIGSNGAGKTTMIRCLLGEYVHQGVVTVDGKDSRKYRTEVLKHIGFVPQLPPPLKMPIHELFRFSAAVCGSEVGRMSELAARLGLDMDEVGSKPFVKLSGGQKQKILVAVALGRDTKLLILDEPTANLDPAARQILFSLLAERINQPIIISSHRLEEVAGLVNRVIELDRGRVVLDDRVADAIDPGSAQNCELGLGRAEPAFAAAIGEWGFSPSDDGLTWRGEVAGPDRLRFLGMLSRYAGILTAMHLSGGRLSAPRGGNGTEGEADAAPQD